ncbi:hypothetical protein TCAL_02169 [Tigriopus californicus]|uniref:Translocon-associated protein subunit alpha n=1 Tax=Tigriopus californicus TaxID=6832 RepID=A0A553N7S1_TIGCA|nr:translocon-associated protein subunit alpha-like [Tigriopus californicus]TRY61488.1 hypothetical protein TCAL_02169 [Tigriopus californicus]|eukprot:TCALIF_02169-PA protein Name:"Similar to SSR1 Translocon-associated protein subunit alpha (Homo sapiens)" AED:0.00 eAED:0.00 QI:0/-1/0/1/-1/1/1/0/275
MTKWLVLLLLVSPLLIQFSGSPCLVQAQEDEVEEDGAIEDEDVDGAGADEDDGLGLKKNVSPDVDTTILFTKPTTHLGAAELPGGQIVEFLVGFTNKGPSDFVVESLDASFRYAMDFSYHIQNFSAHAYQKTIKPNEETTLSYSFVPADAFAGRPIGLTVNLAYRDLQGNLFMDPVFNETVQVVEFDEGFDTEVFFMYVFIVAGALLVLFLAVNLLSGKSKGKKSVAAAKPVETGTANDDVDYEWIPRTALRTPGSNKTSPKQRKAKRNASSDED